MAEVYLPGISLFSPRVFYIDEVPTRVLLPETLLITGFALLCATAAAYLAIAASKYRSTNTVLVDMDLRRPQVNELFKIRRRRGVA